MDILSVLASLSLSGTSAAPLVRMKLLMQNQTELVKSGLLSEPYKGIGDCFSRTTKNEGFLSLWRGNSASLLLKFPIQFQRFIFKCYFRKMVQFGKKEDSYWKRYVSNLVSACASDVYCRLFLYSLIYARTNLANDVKSVKNKRQFKGVIDVYRKTLKSEGLLGLYHGFGVACFHSVVYRALSSGLYDFLMPMVPAVSIVTILFGWGIGIAASLGAYPVDTIHRRVMLSSGKKISSIATFKQIASKEGVKSLYKGADADVLSILVSEMARRLYLKMFPL